MNKSASLSERPNFFVSQPILDLNIPMDSLCYGELKKNYRGMLHAEIRTVETKICNIFMSIGVSFRTQTFVIPNTSFLARSYVTFFDPLPDDVEQI